MFGTSRETQQTFSLVMVQHSSIPLKESHHLAVFVPDSIHNRSTIVPATSDAIAARSLRCIKQMGIVCVHTCLLQPELKTSHQESGRQITMMQWHNMLRQTAW